MILSFTKYDVKFHNWRSEIKSMHDQLDVNKLAKRLVA